MLYLLILLLIIATNFWFLKKNYGYTLCLILSFSLIFSFLISLSGLSGIKLILLYSLYLAVLVKGFIDGALAVKKDPLFISVCLLFISIIISNLYLAPSLYRSRIIAVNTYQRQLLIQVIVPYMLTIIVLSGAKKITLREFIKSIPFWGGIFIVLIFALVDLSEIDFRDRMTIEETSGLSTIGLSRYFALIFIASLMLFLNNVKKNIRIYIKAILLVATASSFFYLFLVGQRGTIIGVVFGLALFFILNIKSNFKRYLPVMLLLSVVIFLVIEYNAFGLFDRFADLKNYREFERFMDYFDTWNIFKQNSFLFPEGSMGYEYATGRSYPHNMVLECMVEYGIVGLVSSLMIIVIGGIYCVKILRNDKIAIIYKAIPVIWIAEATSVLISANIIGNQLFFTYTALLTVLWHHNGSNKKIGYVKK